MNWNYLSYSIIEIDQNTEKSSEETQTPVNHYKLTLVWQE